MAKYTINVTSENDLKATWVDSNCPNLTFSFEQSTLNDCIPIDETTWEASYHSLETTNTKTYTYLDMVNGGEKTYTLQPGEYGVKPS